MLTSDHIAFPSLFPPATPTLDQILGSVINYVNFRPYQRLPMNAVGVVIGYNHHKNGDLYLRVENTTTKRQRWINAETDFISYCH